MTDAMLDEQDQEPEAPAAEAEPERKPAVQAVANVQVTIGLTLEELGQERVRLSSRKKQQEDQGRFLKQKLTAVEASIDAHNGALEEVDHLIAMLKKKQEAPTEGEDQ